MRGSEGIEARGPAIKVDGLAISYGSDQVLEGVDLEVQNGEIVAILAPSGFGKSSLLRVIAGLQKPLQGSVQIMGRSPEDAVARGLVAYALQEHSLLPWLDGEQNALWLSKMRGVEVDQQLLDDLWGLFALAEGQKRSKPKALSGGQRQRISVVRTLLFKASIYLLDEPLSAVDYLTRRKIVSSLRERVRADGAACIYITHDLPDAIHIADRVLYSGEGSGLSFHELRIALPAIRDPKIREDAAFFETESKLLNAIDEETEHSNN